MNCPQPVPAQSKEILNDTVNLQEQLSLVGRFESSHLPLALSCRLMRNLGPIVRIASSVVRHQRHHLSVSDTVATELVSHETKRLLPLTF